MCSGGRGGPQPACSALPVSAVAGPRFARFTEPRSGLGSSATVANWASRRPANLSFGAPEPATHQRLLTAVENGDAGRSRANGRSRTSFIGNWMSRSAKIIAASGQATPLHAHDREDREARNQEQATLSRLGPALPLQSPLRHVTYGAIALGWAKDYVP